MTKKTRKPRRAGHALTAKNLPSAAYNAIHNLPRGWKHKTLVALLLAAADLAKKDKAWHEGSLSVVSR